MITQPFPHLDKTRTQKSKALARSLRLARSLKARMAPAPAGGTRPAGPKPSQIKAA